MSPTVCDHRWPTMGSQTLPVGAYVWQPMVRGARRGMDMTLTGTPTSKLTGGEAVVRSLIAHGVDTLFGLPGIQNDWLYNALYDADGVIRVIHTRHEQGAAYLALGYALARGDLAVCSVVPGPAC